MDKNSKILILMSDNRGLMNSIETSDYNSLVAVINYNYSKLMGYDFLYIRKGLNGEFPINNCYSPKNELRHSSWSKLLTSIKIVDEYPQYDYVVYIDSDCIFLDTNLSIFDYLLKSKVANGISTNYSNIIFLNDKPWSSVLPCAGFYIFKNNYKTKELFQEWYNTDDPKNNLNHNWEQNSLYINLENFISKISVIDDWMFRDFPSQFLRHIGSDSSSNRIPFFLNVLTKLNLKDNYSDIITYLNDRHVILFGDK